MVTKLSVHTLAWSLVTIDFLLMAPPENYLTATWNWCLYWLKTLHSRVERASSPASEWQGEQVSEWTKGKELSKWGSTKKGACEDRVVVISLSAERLRMHGWGWGLLTQGGRGSVRMCVWFTARAPVPRCCCRQNTCSLCLAWWSSLCVIVVIIIVSDS